MTSRRLGEWAVILGGVLCIIGTLGSWSSVPGFGDIEFVNRNERWLVLAAGCVLVVVGVLAAIPVLRDRWPRVVTVIVVWGAALVVGLCFIDTAKKIDSVEVFPGGHLEGHVGWGLWTATGGAVIALVGLLGELVERRAELETDAP